MTKALLSLIIAATISSAAISAETRHLTNESIVFTQCSPMNNHIGRAMGANYACTAIPDRIIEHESNEKQIQEHYYPHKTREATLFCMTKPVYSRSDTIYDIDDQFTLEENHPHYGYWTPFQIKNKKDRQFFKKKMKEITGRVFTESDLYLGPESPNFLHFFIKRRFDNEKHLYYGLAATCGFAQNNFMLENSRHLKYKK